MRLLAILVALAWVGCSREENKALSLPVGPANGTDVGSAGDNVPDEHLAAWFVAGHGPIRVCFEVAPDFGVTRAEARAALVEALRLWGKYFEPRRIALEPRYAIDHCSADTELAVYFGVESARVKAAKGQFYNPTAFVHREKFDRDIPRGKGFVWVAKQASIRAAPPFPDWRRGGRLLAVLLHELGHVYGSDHVPGTIMAAEISELLDSAWSETELARIDHCRELAPCNYCQYRSAKGDRVFRNRDGRFVGMQPKGEWAIAFDGVSTKAVHSSGAQVFKILNHALVTAFLDQAFVQYATTYGTMPMVMKSPIALEYNLATCTAKHRDGRSMLQISRIENGRQWLFGIFADPEPIP